MAWQEREGGVFEDGRRVDTPMHTMRILAGMGFNTLSPNFCDWNYNDLQIWNENEWKKKIQIKKK